MMLDYRVVMLSDANAALTDEEHAASLDVGGRDKPGHDAGGCTLWTARLP